MTNTLYNCHKFLMSPALALSICIVASSFAPTQATAQDTLGRPSSTQSIGDQATLLADSVNFDGTQLVASGHVEILYQNSHISAEQIKYDQSSGALTISGPIKLTEGSDGSVIILASAAELNAQLREGVLRSARIVIDQQLQLAAARVDLIEGRFTRLGRSVASACRVCEGRVPLWEIRAKEIVHDNEERQLYFTGAQFRLWNVPLFYFPKLRLPDPSVDRARGFLIPEFRDNSVEGTGFALPYFFPIGDDKDITITPFVSSTVQTLGFSYRQAFSNGDLEISGAVTNESDGDDGTRGYLFFEGDWKIHDRWDLGVNLRTTSDITYLLDYGIFGLDRLPSSIELSSFDKDEAFDFELISFRTLRESEEDVEDTVPIVLGDAVYRKNFALAELGTAWVETSTTGHYRSSDVDDEGTDIFRISGEFGWKNSYIRPIGLRFDTQASLTIDNYYITQSSEFEDTVTLLTPSLGVRASYPLERTTSRGAQQTLTPIAQLSWSETSGGDVPNVDSTLTEFDEGNLFEFSQYAGADRRETGTRATFGLQFDHFGPAADYSLAIGRIFSTQDDPDFSDASGLSESQSDYLVSASLALQNDISLDSRVLFDTDLTLSKWETRFDMQRDHYSLAAVHSFVIADEEEDREEDLEELALKAKIRLSDNWSVESDYRFNFEANLANTAGIDINYTNECTSLDIGLRRRFTNTDELDPVTSLSISVSFGAFGSGISQSRTHCNS